MEQKLFPNQVSGSQLGAVLDLHSVMGMKGEKVICRCGESDTPEMISQHFLERAHDRGIHLVPSVLVQKPIQSAVTLMNRLTGTSSPSEWLDMPMRGVESHFCAMISSMHCAYGQTLVPEKPQEDHYISVAREVLREHSLKEMFYLRGGNLAFVCSCGSRWNKDYGFEGHRLQMASLGGVLWGSSTDFRELDDTLHVLSSAFTRSPGLPYEDVDALRTQVMSYSLRTSKL